MVLLVERRVDGLRDLLPNVPALQFLGRQVAPYRVRQHVRPALVGVGDTPVRVEREEGVPHPVEHLAALAFDLLALADVPSDARVPRGVVAGLEPVCAELVGDAVTVGRDELGLHGGASRLQQLRDRPGQSLGVVTLEEVDRRHRRQFRLRVAGHVGGRPVPVDELARLVEDEEEFLEHVEHVCLGNDTHLARVTGLVPQGYTLSRNRHRPVPDECGSPAPGRVCGPGDTPRSDSDRKVGAPRERADAATRRPGPTRESPYSFIDHTATIPSSSAGINGSTSIATRNGTRSASSAG